MSSTLARMRLAFACVAAACSSSDATDPAVVSEALENRSDAGSDALVVRAVAPARAAFTTDGKQHFVYELFFQNAGQRHLRIEGISVHAQGHRGALLVANGELLAAMLQINNPDGTEAALAPNGFAFAHVDLALPLAEQSSDGLSHHITIAADSGRTCIDGPHVDVLDKQERALGPPLHGDNLLDLNGCCNGGHARAVLAIDRGVFGAQRYAIDFVRVQGESTFEGDPALNESYHLYGAEVVAAEAGRIIASSDEVADRVPTQPLPPFDPATAAGNHVIQELPDGRFVLYGHLQPHSLQVKPGDEVQGGQVLARVGNSGNSSEPHLHFQVMDAPTPLVADGLPFTFRSFQLVGVVDPNASTLAFFPAPPPRARRNQLPMIWDVVSFP